MGESRTYGPPPAPTQPAPPTMAQQIAQTFTQTPIAKETSVAPQTPQSDYIENGQLKPKRLLHLGEKDVDYY